MAAGGNREQKQCVLHEGEQRITTPHSQVGAVGNWGCCCSPQECCVLHERETRARPSAAPAVLLLFHLNLPCCNLRPFLLLAALCCHTPGCCWPSWPPEHTARSKNPH